MLVVEDEPDLRHVLRQLLTEEGYGVAEAADGVEALERCADSEIDVMVLDLMLPRVDGFEVIAASRRNGLRAPIIAMSASAEHLATAQGLGVAATLTKPFLLEDLLGKVRAAAERTA